MTYGRHPKQEGFGELSRYPNFALEKFKFFSEGTFYYFIQVEKNEA